MFFFFLKLMFAIVPRCFGTITHIRYFSVKFCQISHLRISVQIIFQRCQQRDHIAWDEYLFPRERDIDHSFLYLEISSCHCFFFYEIQSEHMMSLEGHLISASLIFLLFLPKIKLSTEQTLSLRTSELSITTAGEKSLRLEATHRVGTSLSNFISINKNVCHQTNYIYIHITILHLVTLRKAMISTKPTDKTRRNTSASYSRCNEKLIKYSLKLTVFPVLWKGLIDIHVTFFEGKVRTQNTREAGGFEEQKRALNEKAE